VKARVHDDDMGKFVEVLQPLAKLWKDLQRVKLASFFRYTNKLWFAFDH